MQELTGLPWRMRTLQRSFPFCSRVYCRMCIRKGRPLRGKVPNRKNLLCQCSSQGPLGGRMERAITIQTPILAYTYHSAASLVPVSVEALQRERRQMQAKHLWYNVNIRWSDLKDKLEVLAPTGLTRDDIWRHLFLTKQRKNPYEERLLHWTRRGRCQNRNGRIRSIILSNTRRMALALLALIWIELLLALTLTTLQHFRQLKTQKLYMHVDGRPKKVRTVSRGELCLMYETSLSRMIMQLPPVQMANQDGDAGMETLLWEFNITPNDLAMDTSCFLQEFYI